MFTLDRVAKDPEVREAMMQLAHKPTGLSTETHSALLRLMERLPPRHTRAWSIADFLRKYYDSKGKTWKLK